MMTMMKTIKSLFLCVLTLAAASCGRPQQASTTGTTPAVEQRVDALLSRMTLAEKIGQMNQVTDRFHPQ